MCIVSVVSHARACNGLLIRDSGTVVRSFLADSGIELEHGYVDSAATLESRKFDVGTTCSFRGV